MSFLAVKRSRMGTEIAGLTSGSASDRVKTSTRCSSMESRYSPARFTFTELMVSRKGR
jgi:hypothetical protein